MIEINSLSKGIQMIYLSSLRKQSQKVIWVCKEFSPASSTRTCIILVPCTEYQNKRTVHCVPLLLECFWLWTERLTAVLSLHHHTYFPCYCTFQSSGSDIIQKITVSNLCIMARRNTHLEHCFQGYSFHLILNIPTALLVSSLRNLYWIYSCLQVINRQTI